MEIVNIVANRPREIADAVLNASRKFSDEERSLPVDVGTLFIKTHVWNSMSKFELGK